MSKYKIGVSTNGSVKRYLGGQYYAKDLPSIYFIDGTEYWFNGSILHREDGPAIVYYDRGMATYHWYIKGKEVSEDGKPITEGVSAKK